MIDTKRAGNVCQACSMRKRGCNKALPACAFCSSHDLPCNYNTLKAKQKYNPGRHFIPLQSESPQVVPDNSIQIGHYPVFPHPSLLVLPQAVEQSLNDLTKYFLRLTNLEEDDIITHYAQNTNIWLPVLSCNTFREEALRYRKAGETPPVDFSVLLLAILLSILPALDPAIRPTREVQSSLYSSTKSAFAQAQISISTSLRLVQASLLIALRDYTCVRPDAAYVSVTTCAGMARISKSKSNLRDEPGLEDVERKNFLWALAVFERIVFCEINQRDLQPQTEYPENLDCQASPASTWAKHSKLPDGSKTPTLSSNLGLGEHSFNFLDRVLTAIRLDDKKDSRLTELTKLDSEIRKFLGMLMDSLRWTETLKCVHVAMCTRLLFLVHSSILENLQVSTSESDLERREMSWTGLGMISRMTLEVVDLYGENEAQILPISRFYCLRAARSYLQERNTLSIDETRTHDIRRLFRAEETYRKMWMIQDLPSSLA